MGPPPAKRQKRRVVLESDDDGAPSRQQPQAAGKGLQTRKGKVLGHQVEHRFLVQTEPIISGPERTAPTRARSDSSGLSSIRKKLDKIKLVNNDDLSKRKLISGPETKDCTSSIRPPPWPSRPTEAQATPPSLMNQWGSYLGKICRSHHNHISSGMQLGHFRSRVALHQSDSTTTPAAVVCNWDTFGAGWRPIKATAPAPVLLAVVCNWNASSIS